ncbi:MAG: pyridoxal phosphate-dependent aminotransferase [Syntrophales bacterium]|jgi:aspartate/methionine/tyrosine aminotransferase|nr:pyridoxal phosphate-dependent aminotransferase [Syntrophales bacterium]MCK9528717.1 pyridoxal phosphate-dependent aminotransferase [Syntrophales bacterium]MDX9922992.1 pyridoxal phosphate-dependent aminotransferase [Syntrophales bacterium]
MRFDIAKSGTGLTYEIRNIVGVADKLRKYGKKITWENIGDPIAKGETVPDWMKDTLIELMRDDGSYAYSPTKGINETREFIAEEVSRRGKYQLHMEDIIFFNGLGDAIARAYSAMRIDARIIMPEPTYSTHLLSEIHHASFPPNTYRMNPYHNWHPDIAELERKVKSHNTIVGALVINPDNPTGFVYPPKTIQKIVSIAKEYDLFLIFDETYRNIIYNDQQTLPLSDVIGDVPGMSMKGISKEFPWPGARCGWIEVYNADKDETFSRYIAAILTQKMSEVCSTTLPQMAIPKIMTHPEYGAYLEARNRHYERLSSTAFSILKDVPYIVVNRTNGAFYMTVVFNEAVLNSRQNLAVDEPAIRDYAESIMSDKMEYDKRFVYYLLAATGICLVPLTSFFTSLPGFRLTLLEKDEGRFEETVQTIASKIVEYVESSR